MKQPYNPLNSTLARGIREVGFRKWYERELLSSHAHMLLCLLATIAMIASFEAFAGASFEEKVIDTVFVVASGAIGVWALRRYLFLLMHAEELANQAVCPHCETYGRLDVVEENTRTGATAVRCRKCSHEWTMLP